MIDLQVFKVADHMFRVQAPPYDREKIRGWLERHLKPGSYDAVEEVVDSREFLEVTFHDADAEREFEQHWRRV